MIKEAFAIRNQLPSGSDDSIEAMSGRLGMNKGGQTALNRDPGSVCKRYPFWRGGTTALAPGGAGQDCAAGASAVAWEGALSARRGF